MLKPFNVSLVVLIAVAIAPQSIQAKSVDQVVRQGLEARQAGRYSEAESLLNSAAQRDPKNASALLGLGLVLQDKGQLDRAISTFRQAVQAAPNNPGAQSALKLALDHQRRMQQFRADKLKSLKSQLVGFDQAIVAQDAAILAIRQILQQAPKKPANDEIYVELGNNLLKRNRSAEERLALLRETQLLEPGFKATKGEGLANLDGRLNDAIAAFQSAIALNPNLPEAHYGLGNALFEKNRMADAIAAYQKALQLSPQDVYVQTKLERAKQRLQQSRV
jgi:tetratricopeptide (TPR) repeat protein